MIILNSVEKKFKNFSLKVSLEIQRGEIFGIVGENGSGKTTLLKIISGWYKSRGVSLQSQNINYSPQRILLYENLSVEENVRFFSSLYDIRSNVDILKSFSLFKKRKEMVKNLSYGMKRKLNVLVSVLNFPDILLLDEPTENLDLESRDMIWNFLKNMRDEHSTTIVVATHSREEAAHCNRVCTLNNGKVMEVKDGISH
ncbi:MAG: ABC transporter ATP-binding protein [Euryarchaeota archaeon]|nr:ABC transporter ATP-binding protein [Euryarchaeota archaeon]